jgi:hypothetical protein
LSDRSSSRDLDTLYVVRALAITAVVAHHATTWATAGGLNLLLLLSGIAFAQLAFGGHDRAPILAVTTRFLRPLVIWSVVLCALWFAVFQRVEWAEILMVSNWITDNRVSKFPIWYTQVLVQIMVVLVPLFWALGLTDKVRARPVAATLAALALTVALAAGAQMLFDTDELSDKLPHLHAWNFVLGWVFWAVLMNRKPTSRDRLAMTALCVPLLLFMFLALDVPWAEFRVRTVILPVLLLIWVSTIRLPGVVVQPVLLISQATLFLFFLHYPFLLTVREVLDGRMNADLVDVLQFVAGMVGPILVWAVVTAAQRTLRHARSRRAAASSGAPGPVGPAQMRPSAS